MKNDFNKVAKYYKSLSKLVFGNALIDAQLKNLSYIKDGDCVLWAGGGDGELLEYMPESLKFEIDYVELSEAMIDIAKTKKRARHISFIKGDVITHQGSYDVILANFFLDCFNEYNLPRIVSKLKSLLNSNGILLVTDFALPHTKKDKVLLHAMHYFFRLFSNLESKKLQPIHDVLKKGGFKPLMYEAVEQPRVFKAVYRAI